MYQGSINAAAFAGASIIQVRGTTWPPAELDREIDDTTVMFRLERSLEGSTTYQDYFRNTNARRTRIIPINHHLLPASKN
ncbi:hypothetical protein VCV18_003390 [Metarhizium anisopliae]